jgi:hypothetical protein
MVVGDRPRRLPGHFRVAVAMIAILTIADHSLTG